MARRSDTRPSPCPLAEAALAALAAERGASAATLVAYRRDIAAFRATLTDRGVEGLAAAGPEDVRAHLAQLTAAGRAASSRARALSALRSVFRLLAEDGLIAQDPMHGVAGPTPRRRPPDPPTANEIDRLIGAADSLAPLAASRARALVTLLYGSGLRVSEAVGLPVATLRAALRANGPAALRIRGKGGVERMAPLSEPARAAALAWLSVRDSAPARAASPHAFPGRHPARPLTREAAFRLLKDLAARAGLDPSLVSPHALRHAFATDLLSGGADLRVIQTLLGHRDIGATEIYTHVDRDRLSAAVAAHHPLASAR